MGSDGRYFIAGAAWRWGFWLRVMGYGFAVSTDPPLFSEWHGYARNVVRVFGVKLEWLTP